MSDLIDIDWTLHNIDDGEGDENLYVKAKDLLKTVEDKNLNDQELKILLRQEFKRLMLPEAINKLEKISK